jgi:hypothetical protein
LLHPIFYDPSKPYGGSGDDWTVQIHSPLPDTVPVGHYEAGSVEPVVDEMVPRAEYLDRIQQACARHGEACLVRFYDHCGYEFDASVLDQLTETRSLQIDPYCAILNPEAVARLPKLTGLSLAPRGKVRKDLLNAMGVQRLRRFTLAETSTPPLDLSPLGEADHLDTLRLLARGANTEAVSRCRSLTELSMHPTEKIDLGFINQLQQLEVLKFSLGKIASITAIGSLPNLRDLSFDNVNMLEDLGDLQRFPRLRRLQIHYQKRLKTLRVGPGNRELEHINVSGIDEIEGFSQLPALKSLWSFDGKFAPDWSELPATLTNFSLPPPSLKKREKHFEEVRAHGLIPERHPDALFFYK